MALVLKVLGALLLSAGLILGVWLCAVFFAALAYLIEQMWNELRARWRFSLACRRHGRRLCPMCRTRTRYEDTH